MPHVLKTDFYVAKETMMGFPAYCYITEAYYETMEQLENSFFTPEAQAKLKEDTKRLGFYFSGFGRSGHHGQ
jgi:hypothetical protein